MDTLAKVPYSGKFLWEKTFANFVNERPHIFLAKIEHRRCGHWAFSNLQKNSRNLTLKPFANIFSHENFPLYGIKSNATLPSPWRCIYDKTKLVSRAGILQG